MCIHVLLTANTLETLPILNMVLDSGTSVVPFFLTPTPPDFRTFPLYATLNAIPGYKAEKIIDTLICELHNTEGRKMSFCSLNL